MYLCCSGVVVGRVVTLRFQPVPCPTTVTGWKKIWRNFSKEVFDRQKSDRPEFSNYTVLDDRSDGGRLVL
jgi:hypothetical protein